MKPSPSLKCWPLRLAREDDVPALETLIPLSVTLQAPYYSSAQMEAALGTVFGVDRQLIRDGPYFVAENSGTIIGYLAVERYEIALAGGLSLRAVRMTKSIRKA